MELDEALVNYLLTQSDLTAIIGNKIFADEAPRTLYVEGEAGGEEIEVDVPYVVYQNISDVKNHVYGGLSSLQRPRYQFTIYGASRPQAAAIGKIINAAFYRKERLIAGASIKHMKLVNELLSKFKSTDNAFTAATKYLEYEIKHIENI